MARECAQDERVGAVTGLERGYVTDNDCVLPWSQHHIRKLELNTATELESVQVERCPGDVLHLDIFEVFGAVRIPGWRRGWMVHDFCDSQVWHVCNECLHCRWAPGVLPRAGRLLGSRKNFSVCVNRDWPT